MTFPADIIAIGNSFDWPVQRNAKLGPFEVGASTLVFAPDYTASDLKMRAHVSDDRGHTWSEADADNAPLLFSSGNTLRHLSVNSDGDTFYVAAPGSTTTCDIYVFDASTMTWGTTLVGPGITWGLVGGAVTMCWIHRRADDSFVIAAQTAVVATWRQCAIFYGTPGSWTGPLYLPTGTSTAHTGVHTDLLYAITGASDRYHVFYGTGATSNVVVQSRAFDSANAFGTSVNIGLGAFVPSTQFPAGIGTTYEDSGTKIATLWGTSGVTTKVSRVDSLTSDDVANWSVDDVATTGGHITQSNPGVLMNDAGSKLWLWRVHSPDLNLQFTDDGGTGTWGEFTDFKPENPIEIYGICAALLNEKIGLFYCDTFVTGGIKLKFDCLHIYQSKVSQGAGTYVTEHDLGVGGAPDYQILFDSAASSGVSTEIKVQTREDEGSSWSDPVLSVGSEDADGRDNAHTGPVGRFVQITETITGGSMEAGVAGT